MRGSYEWAEESVAWVQNDSGFWGSLLTAEERSKHDEGSILNAAEIALSR